MLKIIDREKQDEQQQIHDKNNDQKTGTTYKVLHNKRKIGITSASFGPNKEFAIVNVCDVTNIQKQEKDKQRERFKYFYLKAMVRGVHAPLLSIHSANENLKMTLSDHESLQMLSLSEAATFSMHMMSQQLEELQ